MMPEIAMVIVTILLTIPVATAVGQQQRSNSFREWISSSLQSSQTKSGDFISAFQLPWYHSMWSSKQQQQHPVSRAHHHHHHHPQSNHYDWSIRKSVSNSRRKNPYPLVMDSEESQQQEIRFLVHPSSHHNHYHQTSPPLNNHHHHQNVYMAIPSGTSSGTNAGAGSASVGTSSISNNVYSLAIPQAANLLLTSAVASTSPQSLPSNDDEEMLQTSASSPIQSIFTKSEKKKKSSGKKYQQKKSERQQEQTAPLGIILGRPLAGDDGQFYVPVYYPSSWIHHPVATASSTNQMMMPATPAQFYYPSYPVFTPTHVESTTATYMVRNPSMATEDQHRREKAIQHPQQPQQTQQIIPAQMYHDEKSEMVDYYDQPGMASEEPDTIQASDSQIIPEHHIVHQHDHHHHHHHQPARQILQSLSDGKLRRIESGIGSNGNQYQPYPLEHLIGPYYVGPPIIRVQDPEAELKLALEASKEQIDAANHFANEVLMTTDVVYGEPAAVAPPPPPPPKLSSPGSRTVSTSIMMAEPDTHRNLTSKWTTNQVEQKNSTTTHTNSNNNHHQKSIRIPKDLQRLSNRKLEIMEFDEKNQKPKPKSSGDQAPPPPADHPHQVFKFPIA